MLSCSWKAVEVTRHCRKQWTVVDQIQEIQERLVTCNLYTRNCCSSDFAFFDSVIKILVCIRR